jgi:hypothetical protein
LSIKLSVSSSKGSLLKIAFISLGK